MKDNLGYKSEKIWREAILRAVHRVAKGEKQTKYLEKLADALVAKGAEGDTAALREIGDRIDGKAIAYVETTVTDARNVRELATATLLDALSAARAAESKDSDRKSGSVH